MTPARPVLAQQTYACGVSDEYDWAEDHYSDSDRFDDYIESEMHRQSVESVRSYLQSYGDAVADRVAKRLGESEKLRDTGFPGPSLVLAITSIEVVIRYLVLMPLLQGAFMSEYWSAALVDRLLPNRPGSDRRLLPAVLKEWDIDLDAFKLSTGDSLWEVLNRRLYTSRNAALHRGAGVDEETCRIGWEAAQLFFNDLGARIAERFRLTWPKTPWHEIRVEKDGKLVVEWRTAPKDPF